MHDLVDELAEECDWNVSTRRSARACITALEFARRGTVKEFSALVLPAAEQTPGAALQSVRDLDRRSRSRQSQIVQLISSTFDF